jgi:CRP-like cAMP-binding protein
MGGVCGTSAQRAEVKRLYDYSLFLQLMGPDRVDTIVRHAHVRRVDGSDVDGSSHPATGRLGQIALVFDGSVELFYNGAKVHVVHARMPLDNGPPVSIIERPRDARYAPGSQDSTASATATSERNGGAAAVTCTTVHTDEALLYWKSDAEIVCRYALETGGEEFILKSVLCDRVELRARSRFLTLASKYLLSPKGEPVPTLNALTNTDLIGALAGVPFFAGLPNSKLEILTEMSAIRVYPSNCVIFREDEGMSTQMFITLAGALEVTSSRAAAPLARLEAGSFFGEMSLLINIPRAATVRAVENCMLLSVEKKAFHALLDRSPDLRLSVGRLLKERLLLKAMASGVLPYFSSVPLARIIALSHGMDIDDQIRKGDCVLDQQADDPRFFFLVYGALEISSAGYLGTNHARDRSSNRDSAVFLTPGCYLGPFTFQRLNMRRGKVYARTPVVVLSCPFERILELFREYPGVAAAANIAWFGERCDLSSVLRHTLLTQRFQAFLEAEHSDENFLFCLDVERYRATGECASPSEKDKECVDERRRLARHICERYIQANAPKEVNLPSHVRAGVMASVSRLGEADDPGLPLFDAAWDEIMRLMTKDSFPRFKKSPLFQSVLDSLDPLAGRKGSKVLDACHAFRDSLHDLRPGQIENVKSNQLNRMMSTIRRSHARHQQRGQLGVRALTVANLQKLPEE